MRTDTDSGFCEGCRNRDDTIGNLELALTSSRVISAAIGIVMATHHVTMDEAFRILSKVSQNTNRKVRDVAEHVVYTGTLIATSD